MRMANVEGRAAVVIGHELVDVADASKGRFGPSPGDVLAAGPAVRDWAAQLDPGGAGGAVVGRADHPHGWGPPVPTPRQVFGIGLNYRAHAAESGVAVPSAPVVFTKFVSCLTGPSAEVTLPAGGSVDWEVELVVVIGSRCERVPEDRAWDRVAGVMVGQDLSERTLQLAGPAPQFSLGKSYPGFGPVGPVLVSVDELGDPDDIGLGCALADGLGEGEVLQKGRTSDLIFPVPELIARLSAVCPLLPGDLIFTGTPAGVGMGRDPRRFLTPGQTLVSWADGVGELCNTLVADPTVSGPGEKAGD
jgi:2-keto-4-pentenoate hydratase/2-oxohepta-3-ene-1,7-dioic acid hydratase in catechol pathway